MTTLESEFMEAYKRVESFCNDLFSCENGISEYINEMKNADAFSRSSVPSWGRDLRMLKRLRFVRNKIAHEPGASGCTDQDFRNLNDFFDRLVNREDPFSEAEALKKKNAEARKTGRKKPAIKEAEEAEIAYGKPVENETPREPYRKSYVYEKKESGDPPPRGCLMALLIFAGVAAITLIVLALTGVI